MGSVVVSSYDDDGSIYAKSVRVNPVFMVFMFIKMVIVHQQRQMEKGYVRSGTFRSEGTSTVLLGLKRVTGRSTRALC